MDRGPASTRFLAVLALIVVAAFGLRVVYVLTVTQNDTHLYDATYYELQARAIANGDGYSDPFVLLDDPDHHEPAADHPPLTVFALLPAALIDDCPLGATSCADASRLAMRLTMVVVGTATVALIGLLARRLGGDSVGIVAAVIAALDPNLWMNDGLIMSEALSVLLTVVILSITYRVLRASSQPTNVRWPWVVALGAVTGLGVLTRAEFVLFVPFLVVPALWVAARGNRGAAVRTVAVAVVTTVLVLTPWLAFNLNRFEKPTLLSTNEGLALVAANCPGTYYGDHIGWVDVFYPCSFPRHGQEESVWNAQNRTRAFDYMADHLDRIPAVALARLGRTFNVYRVGQSASFAVGEGRPEWATWLGAVTIWVLVAMSVVGGFVLRRRRVPIWPLIVPIITTVVAIALWAGGLLRYRAVAEPSFVILAAVGITALVAAVRDSSDDPERAVRGQHQGEPVGQ